MLQMTPKIRRLLLFLLLIGVMNDTRVQGQEPARPSLRLVTYNIHHAEGTDGKFDYQRLANIISNLKPDLVALQEVDTKTRRASGVDQAAHLAELTGMHHAFGNAMHFSGGQYGEAILSRFPLEDIKVYRLPFRAGQEPRCALAARIKPDNGLPEFVFVGTHLCHQSKETRTEQAQQINRIFAARDGLPVILAGDLNARPKSDPMKELLTERWIDAIAPQSRIGYILYRSSGPWRVVEVNIVDDRVASDHRPVLAVLQWQGKQEP